MKLHVVPRTEVEPTFKANSQPELRLEPRHNTHNHKFEEIQDALPYFSHVPPKSQPWILFGPFVDLIAESQGLDRADVHTITLPPGFLSMVQQY